MVYIIFGLVLGCCGLLLWWLDRRRKTTVEIAPTTTDALASDADGAAEESASLVVGGVEVHPVPLEDEDAPAPVKPAAVGVAQGEEEIDSAEDILAAQAVADDTVREELKHNAETDVAAEELESTIAAEDVVVDETTVAVDDSPGRDASAPASEYESTETAQTTAQTQVSAQAAAETNAKARSRWRRIHLPGLNPHKRERQQWAAQHGFEYTKSDALLADEWTRNAAATGAAARDVVSGIIAGYEVHLADVAGVSILALRRAVASEVIVEFERKDQSSTPQQAVDETFQETALVPVATLGDFAYSSTEPAVAQRMIDARLHAAIAKLNAHIVRVWTEYEWLLLEWDEHATTADWDESLTVAADFADITRVLPPIPGTQERAMCKTQMDPSRNLPDYFPEPVHPPEHSEDTLPQVAREAVAVNLPTRGQAQQHGAVELRGLGTDEVSAIGDGQKPADDHFGTRVLRSSMGSSIFDDIAAELGTDPLEDRSFPGLEENPSSSAKLLDTESDGGVDDASAGQQD
ncbi:MAG: hypothetical protein Q3976_09190 [Corynebacterium sp.]|nr:hypothetical protein [Corynebacterium sp.]